MIKVIGPRMTLFKEMTFEEFTSFVKGEKTNTEPTFYSNPWDNAVLNFKRTDLICKFYVPINDNVQKSIRDVGLPFIEANKQFIEEVQIDEINPNKVELVEVDICNFIEMIDDAREEYVAANSKAAALSEMLNLWMQNHHDEDDQIYQQFKKIVEYQKLTDDIYEKKSILGKQVYYHWIDYYDDMLSPDDDNNDE